MPEDQILFTLVPLCRSTASEQAIHHGWAASDDVWDMITITEMETGVRPHAD